MEILVGKKKIDFMKYRVITGIISLVLVGLSILSVAINHLNWGIDFKGGLLVEVRYQHKVELDDIRDALKKNNYDKAVVKFYGESVKPEVHIYLEPKGDNRSDAKAQRKEVDKIMTILNKETTKAPNKVELRGNSSVSAQVGEELAEKGFMALLIALAGILIYVSLRFEYRFAVGSVAALVHDVVIIIGVFSITGIEFDLSVLAALLAVVGYSLNDTIVVFDRIRENFVKLRKSETLDILNISITETMSRTIITSLTTLLVVLAMLFFGGETLFGFSFALFIGIIVGTYSSIFVASNAAYKLGISRVDMMPVKKEGEELDEQP